MVIVFHRTQPLNVVAEPLDFFTRCGGVRNEKNTGINWSRRSSQETLIIALWRSRICFVPCCVWLLESI